MAEVHLHSVSKSYDGRQLAVDKVSLVVPDGELTVFVGPSGCGKSTLLRMIAGLESISAGDISIGGIRVNDMPARERDIAMVFQDYALYPHKTVRDNMAFGLRLRHTPEPEIRRRVGDAAQLLQIEHLLDRKPAGLSGGQRQRVAIGRAIVRQPKVFLFDEPLSNLDAQLRTEMRAEIKRLHQRLGATIIYVTHDQVEAMTLANRIAVLQAGHLQQYDTPGRIYREPSNLFVAGFMGSPPMNRLQARLEGEHVEWAGGQRWSRPPAWTPHWPQQTPLVLGIRPEHITLGLGKSDDLRGQAQVQMLEPLGAETLLTLAIGSQSLICRGPAETTVGVGDVVDIAMDARQLQAFKPDTGLRW
jgi:multiple sugar transport system ATP-binding protein